uniref:Uncharacterized protein n=1 Tax=Oryza glumipatula TaxID=40148 RepID=A0A0D9Y9L3_9ORYZ
MSEETSREGLRDEWRRWQLGDTAAMLEVEEEDPERLTMTSVDDEGVDVQTAMKTTKAVKLRSERTTQLPRAAALRPEGGRRSGNPKLDGVDAQLKTIGGRSHHVHALNRVIKPKSRSTR